MGNIVIRRLQTVDEFYQAVDLQKIYWGNDAEALVPMHMLHSLSHHGANIIGAYDGDTLIGFLMGFLGTDVEYDSVDAPPAADNLLIMSKRMVVLPDYRGQNIGYRLKMAQRDVAFKQGIPLITWTFDPMLAPNAHLNIRKLGGVVRKYKVDYFGKTDMPSLQADRLVIEWWVNDQRVKDCAAGHGLTFTLAQYLERNTAIANPADISGEFYKPCDIDDMPNTELVLIEIPPNFRQINREDAGLAKVWRDHVRDVFLKMFDAGYMVTDFVRGDHDGKNRTFYVLSQHLDEEK
jgi:predicted GNAT superfamily acetyltransferase